MLSKGPQHRAATAPDSSAPRSRSLRSRRGATAVIGIHDPRCAGVDPQAHLTEEPGRRSRPTPGGTKTTPLPGRGAGAWSSDTTQKSRRGVPHGRPRRAGTIPMTVTPRHGLPQKNNAIDHRVRNSSGEALGEPSPRRRKDRLVWRVTKFSTGLRCSREAGRAGCHGELLLAAHRPWASCAPRAAWGNIRTAALKRCRRLARRKLMFRLSPPGADRSSATTLPADELAGLRRPRAPGRAAAERPRARRPRPREEATKRPF